MFGRRKRQGEVWRAHITPHSERRVRREGFSHVVNPSISTHIRF